MTLLTSDKTARKKQLGQYFTGRRVGRLLAALAGADEAHSIIDPMVGSADLLVACLEVGAKPEKLVGIELDPLALDQARAALEGIAKADLILSDAFSAQIPIHQFDLVITNPPYIRYQSKTAVEGLDMPSAESVRAGLVRAIEGRAELRDDDLAAFLRVARTYPGTADLAVPAWILSAALVREGGVLAVVAPQAWLSRNYALTVRELLDELFDVEVIVEDGDASWFEDAQVRTHLVVARRRTAASRGAGHSVVLARAVHDLDSRNSLVGQFRSERAVASELRKVTSRTSVPVATGLTAYLEIGLSVAAAGRAGHVPMRVAAALGVSAGSITTRTLESYGWRCGQGLRTGANDFFYLTDDHGRARPARRWGIASIAIPPECLLPVVRRQSELGSTLDVTADAELPSRVLDLRGWATAEDQGRMRDGGGVKTLPADVARWIGSVAKAPLSNASMKLFPELAAVAPNAKSDRDGRPTAFWYQLPALAPRHRPALFMPRVCGGRPTTYANSVGAAIDANFSTLWPVENDALPDDALLAILNSSWVCANLEATCTVLGGGALKVEATDLRRLALPDLSPAEIVRLAELGVKLRSGNFNEVLFDIDDTIAEVLAPQVDMPRRTAKVRDLAARLRQQRSRRLRFSTPIMELP